NPFGIPNLYQTRLQICSAPRNYIVPTARRSRQVRESVMATHGESMKVNPKTADYSMSRQKSISVIRWIEMLWNRLPIISCPFLASFFICIVAEVGFRIVGVPPSQYIEVGRDGHLVWNDRLLFDQQLGPKKCV